MNEYIIDTNVPVTANNLDSSHASPKCISTCIKTLKGIIKSGVVVIDNSTVIFSEYKKRLNFSGQPGVGDEFFQWLVANIGNINRCKRVKITPSSDQARLFEEFPDDEELERFDNDDKVFVTVSMACNNKPEILNATDTDWWIFRKALRNHGIKIKFLCRELMKDK